MAQANGKQVGGGYYWNRSTWEVEVVGPEGGALRSDARYVKVPFLALFVVVPLLGALLLMALPLIGFATFGYAMVKKVSGGVARSAADLASTVQPGQFSAGAAYFTGKPGEEKAEEEKAGEAQESAEIVDLEKEIAARKEGER